MVIFFHLGFAQNLSEWILNYVYYLDTTNIYISNDSV